MTSTPARTLTTGLAAALAATALWGFTFLGPAAVAPVNVYALVVGRYTVFGMVSLTVLLVHRRRLRALGTRQVLAALHLGIVGYIGFYLLLSLSSKSAGSVLAATLTGLIPLLVAVVSNAMEKVLPWRRLVLPITLTSAGLLLVNSGGAPGRTATGHGLAAGVLLGFLASAAWSYFVVVNHRLLRRSPRPVGNSLWTACIGLGAFAGSLLLVPVARSVRGVSPFSGTATLVPFLLWCVAIAILGSWCATWFWNIASRRLPATVMGPVIAMEAVFGAAFNLLWQHRSPTSHELWGGLLVVAGVLLGSALFHRAGPGRPQPDRPAARRPDALTTRQGTGGPRRDPRQP
ncbi:DMT family transporter [Streptomyces sp. NPDC021356]|uniref:DMT family transporter n=1 Tax=Streptomyces sp. NPDC021356 TaxID=3154900 RepID=UPI00340228D5